MGDRPVFLRGDGARERLPTESRRYSRFGNLRYESALPHSFPRRIASVRAGVGLSVMAANQGKRLKQARCVGCLMIRISLRPVGADIKHAINSIELSC